MGSKSSKQPRTSTVERAENTTCTTDSACQNGESLSLDQISSVSCALNKSKHHDQHSNEGSIIVDSTEPGQKYCQVYQNFACCQHSQCRQRQRTESMYTCPATAMKASPPHSSSRPHSTNHSVRIKVPSDHVKMVNDNRNNTRRVRSSLTDSSECVCRGLWSPEYD